MTTSTTAEATSPSPPLKHAAEQAAVVAAADAEEKAQTPAPPVDTNSSSDDDDDDGKLFRGIRFYLSHSIVLERRMELRMLIKNNGGKVLHQYAHGAVELVESNDLVRGKDWVSVDFVYDSVRDRVRRDVTQYMALDLSSVPTPAVSRTGSSNEAPVKVDARRGGRTAYTTQEDAAMLQYLMDHPPKSIKPMKPLPLSVWKHAASLKITNRTDQSMHQRYKETLARLTPQQRANIMKNARDEVDAQQRRERAAHKGAQVARATPATAPSKDEQPAKASASPASVKEPAVAPAPAVDDALPTAAAAPAPSSSKTTASPPSAKTSSALSSAAKASCAAATVAPVEPPTVTATVATEPSATSEASSAAKTAQDSVAPAAPSGKRQRASSLLSSRWAAIIDDTSRRNELQQFFHLTEPVAAAASASVDGETRRRKRTAALSTAAAPARTQANGKSRAHGKETPAPTAAPTPRKQRKLRQQQSAGSTSTTAALAPAEAAAPATATVSPPPPVAEPGIEDVTSEAAIQALICQIQFATNQDVNAIVHALFYASGDVRVATAFLEGESPCDVWSHDDDVLLEPLVHAATDARAVADACERGAFSHMRVQRTPAQIYTRIRYLL